MTDLLKEKTQNKENINEQTGALDQEIEYGELNDMIDLDYPVKKLFDSVESEQVVEPTCSQWEKFQNELINKITEMKKPKFLSKDWLTTFRDKISSTDSVFLKYSFYVFLTLILIAIFLLGYLTFLFFSDHNSTELTYTFSTISTTAKTFFSMMG